MRRWRYTALIAGVERMPQARFPTGIIAAIDSLTLPLSSRRGRGDPCALIFWVLMMANGVSAARGDVSSFPSWKRQCPSQRASW